LGSRRPGAGRLAGPSGGGRISSSATGATGSPGAGEIGNGSQGLPRPADELPRRDAVHAERSAGRRRDRAPASRLPRRGVGRRHHPDVRRPGHRVPRRGVVRRPGPDRPRRARAGHEGVVPGRVHAQRRPRAARGARGEGPGGPTARGGRRGGRPRAGRGRRARLRRSPAAARAGPAEPRRRPVLPAAGLRADVRRAIRRRARAHHRGCLGRRAQLPAATPAVERPPRGPLPAALGQADRPRYRLALSPRRRFPPGAPPLLADGRGDVRLGVLPGGGGLVRGARAEVHRSPDGRGHALLADRLDGLDDAGL